MEYENMKSTPKVSVVIPVYNPGTGIQRCIDSVCGQTLSDIEILFIDDKGTDDSMVIIGEAAEKDPRIRIYENEDNYGAGFSRNRGIEEACGEYVSFVDPDDYIALDFLELLYARTEENKADIIKGERRHVDSHNRIVEEQNRSLNDQIRDGLSQGCKLYTLFVYNHWTAIYKRDFLLGSHIRYGLTRNSQDSTFLLRACYYAKSIILEDRAIYFYVANDHSRMRDFSTARFREEMNAFKDQMDFLSVHYEDTPCVHNYVNTKILYLLRVQAWMNVRERGGASIFQKPHKKKGNVTEAEKLLTDLREYIHGLPFVEQLCSNNICVSGLIDYGSNLADTPYRAQGQSPDLIDRVDVIDRWVDFICEHPKCGDDSRYTDRLKGSFQRILETARLYEDSIDTKKEVYSWVRKQAKRLPDMSVLTKGSHTISVFVYTGMNVYPIKRLILKSPIRLLFYKIR